MATPKATATDPHMRKVRRKPRRDFRKRAYSDDDRLFALRALEANGGNVSRTARELGLPLATLHQWARLTRSSRKIAGGLAGDGPLDGLYQFKGRVLPVVTSGPPVHLDLSKLSPAEHRQLRSLIEK